MNELEFKQNKRRDIDRLIMGIIWTLVIASIWVIVIGAGIENRLVDGFLGATVTAFILMVQFYFRSSGGTK